MSPYKSYIVQCKENKKHLFKDDIGFGISSDISEIEFFSSKKAAKKALAEYILRVSCLIRFKDEIRKNNFLKEGYENFEIIKTSIFLREVEQELRILRKNANS